MMKIPYLTQDLELLPTGSDTLAHRVVRDYLKACSV